MESNPRDWYCNPYKYWYCKRRVLTLRIVLVDVKVVKDDVVSFITSSYGFAK